MPGLPENAFEADQDPDGDGWQNTFEYKFGTHPLEVDDPGLRHSVADGNLTLTYPEVLSRTDVTMVPKQSADLSSGSWSEANIYVEDVSAEGNITIRRGSVPTLQDAVFMRLETTNSTPDA